MANTSTPAKSGNSRVFITKDGAAPDHAPVYHSCLRMTGLSQSLGDIEKIECPDPYKYGAWIQVGEIRGAIDRVTTSLEGRYALDVISTLRKYSRIGCPVDVQLHFGACTDPSVFNKFDKAIILESASITNYGTDDLGALASGDNAGINETADISAVDAYEVVPLSVESVASTILTKEVKDIRICEGVSCGECDTLNSGCDFIIACTVKEGGSAGLDPDVVFSIDGGGTWYTYDILPFADTDDANSIVCLGDYIVVVSNTYHGYAHASKDDFTGLMAPVWTGVTAGMASGYPNWIDSIGYKAIIVGDGGYIYLLEDATVGVTTLDAGQATIDNLKHVHMLNADVAVAVGENGAVVYTLDGLVWTAATRPVGVAVTLNTVWVKSETEWWVGSSAGNIYYTLDQGVHWTALAFTGAGTGAVYDIAFSTPSVGYFSYKTAGNVARIFRTYNGGYSWSAIPEKTGSMPTATQFNHIATCTVDANFIAAGGVIPVTLDGIIILGQAT